jgi:hypothetical protein
MRPKTRTTVLTALATAATLLVPTTAQAYDPTAGTVYQLPASEACLKGRGNCAIYPKSAELPSGRLVAAFERSTVVAGSGGAAGQTLPVYASDDDGATWQPLSEVAAPAALSDDPAVAQYTSAWTNPYLYVLPEDVGDLAAGTLLLAGAVSGEDAYYAEKKAADPTWVPSNDGDRSDLAIALYASTDEGVTWSFVNIVATGGWQGGAAGATGTNIAAANTYRQVDPVWEPYLLAYDGQLIAYYSDENDHLAYDPVTGAATLRTDNATATDSHGQVLVHRTWDGTSTAWSDPVMDVPGYTQTVAGVQQVGGGRPGMTNVVPTTDGRWILTFEYWGGGSNTRYKIADDPLSFFADGDIDGTGVETLPVDTGSRALARGGSPVIIALPDGRLVYNASGSGSVWVNESGRSDGTWTEYQAPIASGYSRTLQYVQETGRVLILQSAWGGATAGAMIRRAEVDLGESAGAYYRLTARAGGLAIGTGGSSNDANLGNGDVPDVVAETPSATATTQQWHLTTKPDGNISLLNRSGGRAAAVWTGSATAGQRIGQWVDDQAVGSWRLVDAGDGWTRIQSVKNPALYLTAPTGAGSLTLRTLATDGSQEWRIEQVAPTTADLTEARRSTALVAADEVAPGAVLTLDATSTTSGGAARHAGVTGRAYLLDASGTVTDLGEVAFDDQQQTALTLPADLPDGADLRVAVQFDATALVWDQVRTADAAPVAPAWATGTVYGAGDLVEHAGSVWLASWWTQGQAPGDPYGPWQETATTGDGTAVWTASRIFVAGESAQLDGVTYRASWWTRNQRPGDATGPWVAVS